MSGNRRQFLRNGVITTLGVMATSGAGGDQGRSMEKAGDASPAVRRPVLYNADSDIYFDVCPPVVDRSYFERIAIQLADSKVTIFSQCVYLGGRCFYDTKDNVRFDQDPDYRYAPASGRFPDMHSWKQVTNFRRLLAEGGEPLNIFIETAHRRRMKFLACLRMNDRHQFNVDHPPLIVRQHPQMGLKGKDGKYIGGMDFQYPEVREFVFRVMEELAKNYDVDGLELDWMRWCKMFSGDVPKEQRNTILTDYHRRIREMLNEVGQLKGKHLLLSVRVPQTLEECDDLGYDVAAYARDELIDILCPSDFICSDPHMRVDTYKRLTKGTKILLLPSLHSPAGMKAGLLTTEHIRALAHSYYEQGADGMSVYNWFTARELNLPENFTALEEIGDPTFLARRSREYLFNPMYGGVSQTGRLIDYEAKVSRTVPGERAVFPLLIKEDLRQVHVRLQWKVEYLSPEDELRLEINGKQVDFRRHWVSYRPYGKMPMLQIRFSDAGWEGGPFDLYEMANAGDLLHDGENEMAITLIRGNSALDLPISLFEVAVRVQPK